MQQQKPSLSPFHETAAMLETIQGLIAPGWRLIIYSVQVIAKIFHSHLHSHTQVSCIIAPVALYTLQILLHYKDYILFWRYYSQTIGWIWHVLSLDQTEVFSSFFLRDNRLISGGRATGITQGTVCLFPSQMQCVSCFSMCFCGVCCNICSHFQLRLHSH